MTPKGPLAAARRELKVARAALDAFRSATSLDDAEEAWRRFLQDLNRVWTKVQACCKGQTRFSGWVSPYAHVRKKDMLLRYLHHARNSDEHTLTDITTKQAGSFSIGIPPGTGGLYIRSLKIRGGPEGVHVDYEGSPALFKFEPPRLKLERVFDSGAWYNPPTQHLGSPLTSQDPLSVGELGFAWYDRLVGDAEKALFAAG